MVKTFEPARVNSILKENKELILKLKQAEEDSMLKQMNHFRKRSQVANQKSKMDLDDLPYSPPNPTSTSALQNIRKPQVITNNRLHTPGLQRLIQAGDEDGLKVLRREIDDSRRRVRAAKKGSSVQEVSPNHDANFYLPDRANYFP